MAKSLELIFTINLMIKFLIIEPIDNNNNKSKLIFKNKEFYSCLEKEYFKH